MARAPAKQSQYSLEGIAIFANLPADRRERIQQRCSWRRYEPGDPIVDYLDASDDVYFITEGETRVTIYSRVGKVVSFRELGPGATFGEYAASWARARSSIRRSIAARGPRA